MLKGKICYLRALEPTDVDKIYEWENDESAWFDGDTRQPVSRVNIEMLLVQTDADIYQTRQMRLIVCDNVSNQAIGCVDMFHFDPFNMRAEVGIIIDPKWRSKGFATEAINIMLGYLKQTLGLHQVAVSVRQKNEPSIRLFQRLGFQLVGIRREWIKTNCGYEDEQLMQKFL